MNLFKIENNNQDYEKTVDFLDVSMFDEKFEIDILNNRICNIYHIENKFHVPVMEGNYRDMYEYAKKYMIHPEDAEKFEIINPERIVDLFNQSSTPGIRGAKVREKLVDGRYRWVYYQGVMGVEHGVPYGKVYFYVYDIENQENRLKGIQNVSHVDETRNALTGLRNREYFLQEVKKLVEKEYGQWCCVAIDIQHFKIFNSWYGYEKGDYLLSQIGNFLQEMEQSENVVAAYFGRDNFAVFLHHDINRIKKILEQIKEIIEVFSNAIGFLPALGIYVLNENDPIEYEMYDLARLAVEEAKKNYLDRIQYFSDWQINKQREEYELMADFKDAIENNEITFYVQPQCQISTGKIIGGEALVRWIKPDGTMIPPNRFVPFLERSGIVAELDKHVWDSVCQWIRSVIDRGIRPVPISINVSKVDLLSMDVPAYVYSLTQRYNIPARLLKIEITETVYAENHELIQKIIEQFKEKGFKVYLDDFGSGYSSLNMLDSVNADVLKLDMVFMQKENSMTKKGVSIIESIFGMSQSLEIPVIVEGVEYEEQISFLKNLGCTYVQGYYFYKPMNVKSFETLIKSHNKVSYEELKNKSTELFHIREFLQENLFSDSTLNYVLGAVAFYNLEGENLTITRYNEAFYKSIGDSQMDSRKVAIQNYIVKEDRVMLYDALKNAEKNEVDGATCEVRFYKSNNSVFWFYMHFFFLKEENNKKIFYGQIKDVTQEREQSLRFFEVLREQADVTMRMNLDYNLIQYVTGNNTLFQMELPSMDLEESISRTVKSRVFGEENQKAFIEFFNPRRLKEVYQKAIYHEVLETEFKLMDQFEPVEFSTYYIRYSKDQALTVYAFAKRKKQRSLERDILTGMGNRYAYVQTLDLYKRRENLHKELLVFSMDIDGLKFVNDTYGHEAGDEIIKGAAKILNGIFSLYGVCFRVGGDEFIALIRGDRALAKKIKKDLQIEIDNWSGKYPTSMSLSCGYALKNENPELNVEELIRLADHYMYRSKEINYQTKGINRRIQQEAFDALCDSYTKILRVNLKEDSYVIIRAEQNELKQEKGYQEKLSSWLRNFALMGQVHPEDVEDYLKQSDLENIRQFFLRAEPYFSFRYRRKIKDEFRYALLEIIPAKEYSKENECVFLYVKDIEK